MPGIDLHRELSSEIINLRIDRDLARRAARVHEVIGRAPTLLLAWVNPDHKPSGDYVGYKAKVAERLGIDFRPWNKKSIDGLFDQIRVSNDNPDIDGIMTQLPFNRRERQYESSIRWAIAPEKDVDGLRPDMVRPTATASAAVRLLREYMGASFLTQPIGVAGDGPLVGGSVVPLLRARGAKDVKVFDDKTDPLERLEIIQRPILISAMGHPFALTPELFESPARRTVIDAGTAEQEGIVRGDVHPSLREYGREHGWSMTPPKGGLGPLVIRMLLANTVQAAEIQAGLPTPFVSPDISTALQRAA